ncbi:deoxyribodipyrimidine photo-lyase [Actinocorallia sp. B10E7]|uniref:cryptochrome/photolyase family protein n=1 Tax=Actinocorallia sp. B10E7 TaxID=3153558 RepID=UPI00325EDBFA
MLFTRDLRVHDNPALHAALTAAERTVPLFVWDESILAGPMAVPNRLRFLADSLTDLRRALRALGGDLLIRRGDPAAEAGRIARLTGARSLFLADDHSALARRRLAALRELPLRVTALPGLTVIPPGDLTPSSGGDLYRVFTPYWKAWSAARPRPLLPPPGRIVLPPDLDPGAPPEPSFAGCSPALLPGGESQGRRRLEAWAAGGLADYATERDLLAHDGTSRLSAHLRFGTLSPREVLHATAACEPFTRQLAWRDFHYQLAAAFPDLAWRDYRPARAGFGDDPDALEAWRGAATGLPIIDAALRQLHHEGFMHNRARMITASFLTRTLRLDWRHGYRHFRHWLADGDIPNNAANWQRLAGTGNDPRPRTLNPLRQAARFDPDGSYTRRWLPELRALRGPAVHRPWEAEPSLRRVLRYPPPLIDPDSLGRRGL